MFCLEAISHEHYTLLLEEVLGKDQGWGLESLFCLLFHYFLFFFFRSLVTCWLSQSSYLTGVTKVQLWRHLWNMNVIRRICCQTSNISHTKSKKYMLLVSSCSCLCPNQWSQEDVFGAVLTDDAPTSSEWSTIYCLLRCTLYWRIDGYRHFCQLERRN